MKSRQAERTGPVRYGFLRRPGRAVLRELAELYRAAGWWDRKDTNARLRALVGGSHCFLTARRGGRLVGMGRAIGDGASDAYIQDVFVRPEWRGRGLGAQLVRRLARRLAADGLGWIGLVAVPGAEAFYERCGFRIAPGHKLMLFRGPRP
ncbi:MAG: GNAT family N-acetyltransferase [Elusimicrobia bacterium]|nr:GNAT family N-acetyltransferase [Elusimicrobiota bacterium]